MSFTNFTTLDDKGIKKLHTFARYSLCSTFEMKRNPVITVFAALVLAIYCTGLVGFDVHTCSRSGRSFVVSLLCGTSCEDIHPASCGHHSHASCCSCADCADHGGSSYTDSCCSDSFHILELTGEDGSSSLRQTSLLSLQGVPMCAFTGCGLQLPAETGRAFRVYANPAISPLVGDVLSAFCIRRI